MKEMESVLYRMNLDGTDRRKVHTFEQNVAFAFFYASGRKKEIYCFA